MRCAVLVAIFLSGCSASVVATRGNSTSQFAPTNEKTERGGTVKYLNQGYQFARSARREDAYKKMYTQCGGPYRITSEGPRAEGGAVIPVGTGAYFADSQYWYINFECQKDTAR